MRPLELTIEGFRSYRERVTFDWRGRRLVGIVGPIGSGKSSILDAVSFALYGKTPQVEGATKSLIHQLADQSHVELRFQVDGQVWRAVRSLRRKGASGHQLELLADDSPDAQVLEVVTLEGAINERVEQIIGMDFKTFCRSVLLAQNRFSEFLKATPAQRDAVLKGVFGFERLDDALRVAKTRAERIDLELASLGKERERIVEAREHLDEARATAERSRERLHALESAGPEIERLEKERDAAEGDAASAVARMATLTEIAGTLPAETDIASPIAASRDAGARVAAAETVVREADEARAACEAELARVASLHGNREQFRSFANLVETHERHVAEVERTQTAVDGAREELDEARAVEGARIAAASAAAEALGLANEALTAAATDVGAARTTLMAATHAEMAHELRGALVAGEPCPVCAQEVHQVPKAGAAPKVKAAVSALAKAEKTEAKARTERDRCAGADASARTSVDEAGAGIGRGEAALAQAMDTTAAATASLTATKDQLVGWLGEEGDPRSLFEAREAELTAAERAVEAGHRAVEAARAGLDEATRLAEGASAAIATAGEPAVGGVGPPRGGPRRRRGAGGDRVGVCGDPRGTGHAPRACDDRTRRCDRARGRCRARAPRGPTERGARAQRRFPPRAGRGRRGAWHRRRTGDGARGTDRVRERPGTDDPRPRGTPGHREAPRRRPPTLAVPRIPLRRGARRAGGAGKRSLLGADGRRLSLHRRRPVRHRGPERREHEAQGRQSFRRRDVPRLAGARARAGRDGRARGRTAGLLLLGRRVREP